MSCEVLKLASSAVVGGVFTVSENASFDPCGTVVQPATVRPAHSDTLHCNVAPLQWLVASDAGVVAALSVQPNVLCRTARAVLVATTCWAALTVTGSCLAPANAAA